MEELLKKSIDIATQISDNLDKPENEYPEKLQDWLSGSPGNKELMKHFLNGKHISSYLVLRESIDPEREWKLFEGKRTAKPYFFLRHGKWISGIAAALLIPFIATYFIFLSKDSSATHSSFTGAEVMPGKVIATLSIGEENIIVDENMEITTKGGVAILDQSGNAIYAHETKSPKMNRLSVPRGGEYFIELEDGTKVWLNADSELLFPACFDKERREIGIKGEAYLEVAHNANKPFYIKTGNVQVHVQGTAFNVRNFDTEDLLSITLVTGKVTMEDNNGASLIELAPSEKFMMDRRTENFTVENANIQSVVAWKNGLFIFKEEPLISIAQTLERWYNISIDVDEKIQNYRYSGTLSKHASMKTIINILYKTNELKFIKDQNQNVKIIPAEDNLRQSVKVEKI